MICHCCHVQRTSYAMISHALVIGNGPGQTRIDSVEILSRLSVYVIMGTGEKTNGRMHDNDRKSSHNCPINISIIDEDLVCCAEGPKQGESPRPLRYHMQILPSCASVSSRSGFVGIRILSTYITWCRVARIILCNFSDLTETATVGVQKDFVSRSR
jgi:hypothetical protein